MKFDVSFEVCEVSEGFAAFPTSALMNNFAISSMNNFDVQIEVFLCIEYKILPKCNKEGFVASCVALVTSEFILTLYCLSNHFRIICSINYHWIIFMRKTFIIIHIIFIQRFIFDFLLDLLFDRKIIFMVKKDV